MAEYSASAGYFTPRPTYSPQQFLYGDKPQLPVAEYIRTAAENYLPAIYNVRREQGLLEEQRQADIERKRIETENLKTARGQLALQEKITREQARQTRIGTGIEVAKLGTQVALSEPIYSKFTKPAYQKGAGYVSKLLSKAPSALEGVGTMPIDVPFSPLEYGYGGAPSPSAVAPQGYIDKLMGYAQNPLVAYPSIAAVGYQMPDIVERSKWGETMGQLPLGSEKGWDVVGGIGAGAATGAALGTYVFPGVGTAVGAFVGGASAWLEQTGAVKSFKKWLDRI